MSAPFATRKAFAMLQRAKDRIVSGKPASAKKMAHKTTDGKTFARLTDAVDHQILLLRAEDKQMATHFEPQK